MAHQIFISYAAEDKPVADAVCEAVEREGIKCWYAPRDVAYGRDFEESIVDAISGSQLIILVLTSHSNSSAHVKREIQNACLEEVSVPVLPFRVEDVPLNKALRYYIGSVHWLDAITPPLEPHLRLLVDHVKARLPKPAAADPVSEEASSVTEEPAPTVPEKTPVWIPPQVIDVRAPMPVAPGPVPPQPGPVKPKPSPGLEVKPAPPAKVPNYLVPSIAATILCCMPAGVAAIVFSIQASMKAEAGQIDEALAKARLAKIFLIGAAIIGSVVYSIFLTPGVYQSLKRELVREPNVYHDPSPSPTIAYKSPSPTPTPTVTPAPLPLFFSLTGLPVKIFYLSPNKPAAERMGERLRLRGAKVELSETAGSGLFNEKNQLYYYGERKPDANRIASALFGLETILVADKSSGPTRTTDEFQFFLWVSKTAK